MRGDGPFTARIVAVTTLLSFIVFAWTLTLSYPPELRLLGTWGVASGVNLALFAAAGVVVGLRGRERV